MAGGRGTRASRGGSGRRRRGGWGGRAGWLAVGVAAVCLAAAVAVDSDPVGSFVAGVDVSGGGGGGAVGYLVPVSEKLAGSGVVTAGSHVRSDGSCTYGRWSDGSCRACPSGQVWRTGRGCVRAEGPTSCSSGNTYSVEWGGCRPSISSDPPAGTGVVEASAWLVATAMARPAVSYLEEIIPPCVPIEGSGLDPCPRQAIPGVEGPHTTIRLPDELRTVSEFFNAKGSRNNPHIVVRGTVLPNSFRCGLYPFIWHNYSADRQEEGFLKYYCFAEVRINEYIVGTGPPQLTISLFQGTALGDLADWGVTGIGGTGGEELARYMNYPLTRLDPVYGGRELILFLHVSYTNAVETWLAPAGGSRWFIQLDGDDIRAVSDRIRWARTDDHHFQLNRLLTDLVREIKQAAEDRATINGGRIGSDPSLPLYVADANKLVDFYKAVGAVYVGDGATLLPPPVPGGDEPARPPVLVGEDLPGVTVPVPGEEITPPPTDDAAPGGNTLVTTTSTRLPAATTTVAPQVEETPLTAAAAGAVPQG